MSAVERDFYTHAGRVLGRLGNGHNTRAVRHEASLIFQRGVLPEGSQILRRMHDIVFSTWRHLGQVEDSELDATYHIKSPPITK